MFVQPLAFVFTMERTAGSTTALAVYGSMRPGKSHHWVVQEIAGDWFEGQAQGWLFEVTWGDAQGYPGLVLDPNGQRIEVSVLISDRLDKHWHQVDNFEGRGYRRVPTDVKLSDGRTIEASIYEVIQDSPDSGSSAN